jgi:S-formylglutathione hydrolase FrmB
MIQKRWAEIIASAVLTLFIVNLLVYALGESSGGAQFQEERHRGDLTPIQLPGGSVVEFKSFPANTLGTDQPYSIFLPPSYSKDPARTYPVVYFLHGLNNDHTSWTVDRYGNLQNKVEEMILAKKLPEIIMVHPKGDNSFYCNYADGSKRYEDFISEEIVNCIESNYRAKKGRENRAIGGTSMGGFGALKIAMKFPDRYSAAVGHSPIIFLGKNPLDVPEEMKSSRFYQFFVSMLRPLFGDPIQQDVWDRNNPLLLAKSGKLGKLKIHFDYGTGDRYIQSIHLDQGVKALDQALTEAKVQHSFKEYPGEPHGWALVYSHLAESLPFLCQSFK